MARLSRNMFQLFLVLCFTKLYSFVSVANNHRFSASMKRQSDFFFFFLEFFLRIPENTWFCPAFLEACSTSYLDRCALWYVSHSRFETLYTLDLWETYIGNEGFSRRGIEIFQLTPLRFEIRLSFRYNRRIESASRKSCPSANGRTWEYAGNSFPAGLTGPDARRGCVASLSHDRFSFFFFFSPLSCRLLDPAKNWAEGTTS